MDDPLSNLSAEQECRGKRVLDASRYLAMPSGASMTIVRSTMPTASPA